MLLDAGTYTFLTSLGAGEYVIIEFIYEEACVHDWQNATCEKPATCSLCGATDGEALGHTEVIDAAVAPNCTETGLTEGKHCSVCEDVLVAQTVVDALGHTEVTDAAVAATCTETGLTEGKHCSVCDAVLVAQEVVPTIAHVGGEVIVENLVESTCKAEGHYDNVVYCVSCNTEISRETVYTSVLPHTEVTDAAVAATCTETGLTEGKHCSVCEDVLVAQTVVDALGHTFVDDTCTACGVVVKNLKYTISDYSAGSQYAENEEHVLDGNTTVTTTQAHFTSELRLYSSSTHEGLAVIHSIQPMTDILVNAGYKVDTLNVYACNDGVAWNLVGSISVASTSYSDYTLDLGGSYNYVKLDVVGANQVRIKYFTITIISCPHKITTTTTEDATCENAGSIKVTCADCGFVDTTAIPAKGHSYNDGEVTTPATCGANGEMTYTCIVCDTKKTETIEATGEHNFVDGKCSVCGNSEGSDTESTPETLATFEFGENGTASHSDGSSKSSYSETSGSYTLTLSSMTNIYTGACDAMGNSCIKLGSSSNAGSFSFTVSDEVTSVVIYVAKYKAKTSNITINGTAYTLTNSSNDGAYDVITIDTSVNKTVSVTTASGGYRCMINTIEFVGIPG